jgi:hypothetical protein
MTIIQKISTDVKIWRESGYPTAISQVKEILNFQQTASDNQYKFLRKAQFWAIETYLFLRFVKNTPKIIDLYKNYYNLPQEFCKALGVNHIQEESFEFIDTIDKVLQSIDKNKDKYKYHSLIETLHLDYPSYILALAMGSGKTNIISSYGYAKYEFANTLQALNNQQNNLFNSLQKCRHHRFG